MKIGLVAASLAGVLALTCASARADYTGQTITGTLAFGPNGANGGQRWVPNTISVPGTFFYQDNSNTDTVAFTGSTLTVTDIIAPGQNASGWGMTFSDPSMLFGTISVVSDDFSPDLTYSISNGVINLDWLGSTTPGTLTATFDFTAQPSQTPEPSSLALLGTTVLGAAAMFRRRLA